MNLLSVFRLTALNTLYALFSNTKLVREAHEKAAVLFLLDVFCNCETPGFRERAAEVITKMVTDKLVGPKVSFPHVSFCCIFNMNFKRCGSV